MWSLPAFGAGLGSNTTVGGKPPITSSLILHAMLATVVACAGAVWVSGWPAPGPALRGAG